MEALLKEAQAEPPRHFWWHWQNLNDRKDGTQGSGLRHGRAWWHFPLGKVNQGYSRTIKLCWNFFSHLCGVRFDIDDEDVTLMLAFPPVALWLSLSTNWAWLSALLPRKPLNDTNYRDVVVIDQRECGIRIHSGSVWIQFWSKRNEWVKADPWWVRGVNFSINPFEWRFMRHEVRRADGSWELVPHWRLGEDRPQNDPEVLTLPYGYQLKNGTIQDRIATVIVERRAWRPRCLRWTSLFEKVQTCIDVTFNEEVGEQAGSWKGGCTGCGYDLLPNETAAQCLRRMERERKF